MAHQALHDDTCVVVPLFNESAVVGDVIRDLRTSFPLVVAVDDGSTDDSAAVARDAGALVVEHPINLGQGAALQTGLETALRLGAQYVVTFDSDGQHQREDAVAMVSRLRTDEADVVFGSRFLDARTRPGAVKRAVLRAAIVYSNATTGVRLTDTHNGLRALNRRAAATLRIRQNRMAHASEIIEQVGRAGLRWVEHPVHILYTDYSRSKGQSVFNAVNILTEMIYR
ncbi:MULTISPECIES: glycosyltransferase family 2 protein [Cellulomonas]|uniref:Glycosyltransferase involved in cell wall biosynthesis n=1 Tax=Cellulomonas iranensis TaxID=76862 RepID=A0ABU0GNJ0_9CELL|nr:MULTISPECIES: glycosyltransferase family 2 protein [Cellulomonas]MDQ0426519.1 glycosyltransferase involved in cell wall biosynthesis [Cellulomonas iranensis]TFH74174.1 glycosyltransferase family 2 protein [Cellulomonas sp. HD19AZ1]UCN15920.1 glycosyltransferase family 2 protein [Cellulomonas iranensis]